MKMMRKMMMASALILGTLGSAPVFAAEAEQMAGNHSEMAASYEAKAVELDGVIAQHQQMKKAGMTDKTSVAVRQAMEKHCDAILKDATKLRNSYRDFAKWHSMRAAEMKGQ